MNFKSLKRSFLAACPVIGPHSNIESDLMLAGKKPVTWTFVGPDEDQYDNLQMQIGHEGRKRLDKAVEESRLIAIDVEQRHPDYPDHVGVFRHYAQPGDEEKLKRVVEFNKQAFNGKDLSQVGLDKDMGHYLGYRRRDIFFFNHIVVSPLLPGFLRNMIISLNSPCQKALREELLLESGYDLQTWHDNLPKPQNT